MIKFAKTFFVLLFRPKCETKNLRHNIIKTHTNDFFRGYNYEGNTPNQFVVSMVGKYVNNNVEYKGVGHIMFGKFFLQVGGPINGSRRAWGPRLPNNASYLYLLFIMLLIITGIVYVE